MNDEALRLLEFGKVAGILAGYAVTPRGKAKATALRPMEEADEVHLALRQTSEMVRAMGEGYTLPIAPVEDVTRHAEKARAGGAPLEPVVLWRIAECLDVAGRIASSLRRLGSRFPALVQMAYSVPESPELVQRIRESIDSSGSVLDSASGELKTIRKRIRGLRKRIEGILQRMVENPAIRVHLQYTNPTMHRDRYVLPVNAYRKHEVKGLVHGSSDSGATLYIEPMQVIEPGNDLSEALGEEEEEIERILWALTREVGVQAECIASAVEEIGRVDLVRAKALMSSAFDMCSPEVGGNRPLVLQQARHPLLLWLRNESTSRTPQRQDLDFGAVVPMDVHLGDDFRMLLITGPNTGGKTVALKTVGLLCLMARAGMHVPAEQAELPMHDSVWADIGDEQSIEQSLSTFSSHMSRIVNILQHATKRSLVLLDELGAGTDPAEGSALGEAILNRLVETGCTGIVVTHLGALKTYAVSRLEVENASVEFDSVSLRPTYRFEIGTVGNSNALLIAQRLGLPPDMLQKARETLDTESEGEYSKLLEQVRVAREDAEQRRDRMQYLEEQAMKLKAEYEEVLARLKAEQDKQNADVALKIRDRLREVRESTASLYRDVRHARRALARRVRDLRDELDGCLRDLDQLLKGHEIQRPLQEGDEVYVIRLHKWGTIERVNREGDRAKVRVGNVQIEVDVDELQPWGDAV